MLNILTILTRFQYIFFFFEQMFLHVLYGFKDISGDFKGLFIFISYVCFAGELIYSGLYIDIPEMTPSGYVLKVCLRQGFDINSLLSDSDAI